MERKNITTKAERAKQFNKGNYDNLKFNVRKELNIHELLNQGASLHGISKVQYIILAIYERLKKDGIEMDVDSANKYNVSAVKKR